jgi:hypothetical protein
MGVCYTVQTAVCGNGLLEPGEECDDNTGCCNRATCKLRAGAMCTPGECARVWMQVDVGAWVCRMLER